MTETGIVILVNYGGGLGRTDQYQLLPLLKTMLKALLCCISSNKFHITYFSMMFLSFAIPISLKQMDGTHASPFFQNEARVPSLLFQPSGRGSPYNLINALEM